MRGTRRKVSMGKRKLLIAPLGILLGLTISLGAAQPLSAFAAAPVGDSTGTGGSQTNTGGDQSGATVVATGGTNINMAVCVGCNVIEFNVNIQSVTAATVTGGDQTNIGGDQVGATVTATGAANMNIALCVGCKVFQVDASSKTLNGTASTDGQTNVMGQQTPATVSAGGHTVSACTPDAQPCTAMGQTYIASCMGCTFTETTAFDPTVLALTMQPVTNNGSGPGVSVSAGSGMNIAVCYGCNVIQGNVNTQTVSAQADPGDTATATGGPQ